MSIALSFKAPDNESDRTPYACSYHWFRGPDGRVLSLDVIRSSDTNRLGLRVIRERPDGSLDAQILIGPESEWAPMREDGASLDDLPRDQPALSRGPDFIAGQATGGHGNIRRTRFALAAVPEAPGIGAGSFGLQLSYLSVTDFPRVRHRGFVEIDGERLDIDAPGSISLHYGDRLAQYAYLVIPPPLGGSTPRLMVSSISGESMRHHGQLLGDRVLVYAYGHDGLPPFSTHVGAFTGRDIPVGFGAHVALSDVRPFHHDFLDEPTVTASAHARYVPALGSPIDLGRVFIDYRGKRYIDTLALNRTA